MLLVGGFPEHSAFITKKELGTTLTPDTVDRMVECSSIGIPIMEEPGDQWVVPAGPTLLLLENNCFAPGWYGSAMEDPGESGPTHPLPAA